MAIQTTNPTADVTDRSTRALGNVVVTQSSLDDPLFLILNELRRISILLSEMSNTRMDFDEIILSGRDSQ